MVGCVQTIVCEYLVVYVDDHLVAAKNLHTGTEALFKLEGVRPLANHYEWDYFRDTDGTLCYGPRKYISKAWVLLRRYLDVSLEIIHLHLRRGILQRLIEQLNLT
jgi:hypothetical protein